jgi:MinD-like ATPase involved in chromosome partitioning or flagellar assembly
MSLRLITALSHDWEAGFATAVEGSRELTLVRRCADLADLMAVASAGLADIAVVSPEVRWLDRDAVGQLRAHGVTVVGALAPADDAGERRLRQLGVGRTLAVTSTTEQVEDLLAGVTLGDAPLDFPVDFPLDGEANSFHETEPASPDGPASLAGPTRQTSPTGPAKPTGPGDLSDPTARNPIWPPEGAVDKSSAEAAESQPGRVIAVWGPIGSPGRTTISIGIAAEVAAAGIPTLLVDADTYGASVAQALALLDEAPGMAAAARASELGTLDLPALARLAPEVTDRLRVLTGIPRSDRWPELRASAVEHILGLARRLAACVVVDCGFSVEDDEELSYDTLAPRRNAATLAVLEQADELLVVGSAEPIGLQRLVRAVQDIGTVPSPRPRVVVNKVRAGAVGPRPERAISEALSRFAGMEDLLFVPFDPHTLDAAMLSGRTLVEHAPNTAVRSAIRAVAEACLPPEAAESRTGRRRRALARR